MRFTTSTLAAAAVALLATTAAAAPFDLPAPFTSRDAKGSPSDVVVATRDVIPEDVNCRRDEFRAVYDKSSNEKHCMWFVCTGYGNTPQAAWRMVRDCGSGVMCKDGQATSCMDYLGKVF